MINKIKNLIHKVKLISRYTKANYSIFFCDEKVDFNLISHWVKSAYLILPYANPTKEVKELQEHLAYCNKLIETINRAEFRARRLGLKGSEHTKQMEADTNQLNNQLKEIFDKLDKSNTTKQ